MNKAIVVVIHFLSPPLLASQGGPLNRRDDSKIFETVESESIPKKLYIAILQQSLKNDQPWSEAPSVPQNLHFLQSGAENMEADPKISPKIIKNPTVWRSDPYGIYLMCLLLLLQLSGKYFVISGMDLTKAWIWGKYFILG